MFSSVLAKVLLGVSVLPAVAVMYLDLGGYYENIRMQYLLEKGSVTATTSVVFLTNDDDLNTLRAAGATELYIGRVIYKGFKTKQLPAEEQEYQFVYTTTWDTPEQYHIFENKYLKNMSAMRTVVTTSYLDKFQFLHKFLGVAKFFLEKPDLSEPVQTDTHFLPSDKVFPEASKDPNIKGFYVWNLLKKGTLEQQASDSTYTSKMLRFFAHYGAGPMHLCSISSSHPDTHFDTLAAVFYPQKAFVSLINSQWFNDALKLKSPGDTVSLVTIPYGL